MSNFDCMLAKYSCEPRCIPTCASPNKTLSLTATITIPGQCCYGACGYCVACAVTDCCTNEFKACTFTITLTISPTTPGFLITQWTGTDETACQPFSTICHNRSRTVVEETGFCTNLIQVAQPCTCGQGCCETEGRTMQVYADITFSCTDDIPKWNGEITVSIGGTCDVTRSGCDTEEDASGPYHDGFSIPAPTSFIFTLPPDSPTPPGSDSQTLTFDGGTLAGCIPAGPTVCSDVDVECDYTVTWS